MEPIKMRGAIIAAVVVNISAFAAGTCVGWTSPTIIKLKFIAKSASPLKAPITVSDEAWISGILPLSAGIAPFAAGYLSDKIGRKLALLISSIFFILAYLFMLFANELWLILMGRVFQGVGCGLIMVVVPMYVGEIATNSTRGGLGSLLNLFYVCGILYTYCIGPYVSYKVLQCICLIIPILFDVLFVFMPESPHFYIQKSEERKAIKSLRFLRGQSENGIQDEVNELQSTIGEPIPLKNQICDLIRVPGSRKALLTVIGLMFFQETNGIDAVIFNSESIFEYAHSDLSPALSTVIIGLVQVAGSIATPFFADRLNRVTILVMSASVMAVSLTALGFFFFFQSHSNDVSKINWVPLLALILFIIAFSVGFGPIPWAILSEILTPSVKSFGTALCISSSWLLIFLVTFTYPVLVQFGQHYIFWGFAFFCVLALFFLIYYVIETKGLSLQEIQDKLNRRKS